MVSFYKIAVKDAAKEERKNSSNSVVSGTIAASAGGIAIRSSAPKILGYEKVHHGTSSEAAVSSIKSTGLRTSKAFSAGGLSATDAAAHNRDPSEFKGKIYTTKSKVLANSFSGKGPLNSKQTITANVPYRANKRLARDTILDSLSTAEGRAQLYDKSTPELQATMDRKVSGLETRTMRKVRDDTRVYKHSIKPRFIEGSEHYKGKSQFLNKNNFKRYFKQEGGKARFAKGIGTAGIGLAALGYGAHKIYKGLKNKDE